ncbi:putative Armadillo-like helical protein, partial [Pseudoloma neurophilia]
MPSDSEKENTNFAQELSFLVNTDTNDTLLSNTVRHKNLNDQFSENTIGRLELEESLNISPNIITPIINDELIINNSLEYLINFFKNDTESFFDCFNYLKIDENIEKFEKLANIAILLKIDQSKICDRMTSQHFQERYIATYIFVNMAIFQLKTEKSVKKNKNLDD